MTFALKNLRRSPRRTATMLGMIALGTIALVLAGGYAAATFRGLRENTIGNGLGHLQVGGAGFRDSEQRPLQHGLSDVDALRRAIAADVRSMVRFLSAKNKGQTLLMRGDDMWYFLPSVARPIRITPIQRLLGNASNGDVARVRYSIDYEPAIVGEETIEGTRCTVLELRAKRKGATYQRMRYAVRQADAQPVRAEFFLASGKQTKAAFFQEPRTEAGHTVMTRLVIYDHIKERSKTIMQFSGFMPRDLPDKLFNPARSADQ